MNEEISLKKYPKHKKCLNCKFKHQKDVKLLILKFKKTPKNPEQFFLKWKSCGIYRPIHYWWLVFWHTNVILGSHGIKTVFFLFYFFTEVEVQSISRLFNVMYQREGCCKLKEKFEMSNIEIIHFRKHFWGTRIGQSPFWKKIRH